MKPREQHEWKRKRLNNMVMSNIGEISVLKKLYVLWNLLAVMEETGMILVDLPENAEFEMR